MSDAIPQTGTLIWLSVKPIIRIVIPAGAGFTLIKTGLLPHTGTRALATVLLNITLPSLIFSKVVPSFNSSNVSSLGPLILVAFLYQFMATGMGVFARATTQTPIRFRNGIFAAYAFSNWGDLPTAVIQTLAASAPFKGDDEALAIAFISVFILVNNLSMFPLQGLRCVKWDYDAVIDYEREYKCETGELGVVQKWMNRLRQGKPMLWELEEALKGKGKAFDDEEKDIDMATAMQEVLKAEVKTADKDAITPASPPHSVKNEVAQTPSKPASSRSQHPQASVRVLHSIVSLFKSLLVPPVVALFISLPLALVPTLKSLFVYSTDTNFHPTAPDGKPPLAVLYDTAAFVGAASVPLGLVVLGASVAKMVIPRPISRLPMASIGAMAIVKLVLLPVFGYLLVEEGLVKHTNMVAESNHVLRFTLVYFSCVPTGTIQLAYSQLFCPPGEKDNSALLSSYVLAQYVVWIISSCVLTALALRNIF